MRCGYNEMSKNIEINGISQAMNDLLAWHGRVLARVFYPTVPADAARMTLPPSVLNVHMVLEGQGNGAADQAAKIQKLILIVRDAGAAMAAHAVSGGRPDYRDYTEFESYFRDLFTILAHVQHGGGDSGESSSVLAASASKNVIHQNDQETPLQQFLREKRASARLSE